jgi:glucosyl-dolichyl phosphate glucuronosyltransferase
MRTPDAPVVSVIMIIHNGAADLAAALATCRGAIERAVALEPRIELVIVDNRSADEPARVIERELGGSTFAWKVVTELHDDVNSARNAGLRRSGGELLFFVSSDLEFDAGWLEAYIAAAADHPEASVFGGRVKVGKLEAPPPKWLPIEGPLVRGPIVGCCDFGSRIVELSLDDVTAPIGANMGLRRDVFRQFGWFDTRFCLRPESLTAGAETEFFDRLARGGMTFLYVPGAACQHPLRKSQMTRDYAVARLRDIGRATSRLRRLRGDRPRQLCGLTLFMMRRCAAATGRWMAACAKLDSPATRFYARGDVDIALGYLHEDFIAWREASDHSQPQPLRAR